MPIFTVIKSYSNKYTRDLSVHDVMGLSTDFETSFSVLMKESNCLQKNGYEITSSNINEIISMITLGRNDENIILYISEAKDEYQRVLENVDTQELNYKKYQRLDQELGTLQTVLPFLADYLKDHSKRLGYNATVNFIEEMAVDGVNYSLFEILGDKAVDKLNELANTRSCSLQELTAYINKIVRDMRDTIFS